MKTIMHSRRTNNAFLAPSVVHVLLAFLASSVRFATAVSGYQHHPASPSPRSYQSRRPVEFSLSQLGPLVPFDFDQKKRPGGYFPGPFPSLTPPPGARILYPRTGLVKPKTEEVVQDPSAPNWRLDAGYDDFQPRLEPMNLPRYLPLHQRIGYSRVIKIVWDIVIFALIFALVPTMFVPFIQDAYDFFFQ
jgi:hypothetical protein